MPNHITNRLFLRDDDQESHYEENEKVMEQIINLVKTTDRDFDFNTVIPMPTHSDTFFAEGGLGKKEEQQYGENNWYNWSIKNWGTKWNAYDTAITDYDDIFFDTAWATPRPVFIELSKKFPTVEIQVEHADEDIGSNCGVTIYKNGEVTYEENKYGDDVFAEKVKAQGEVANLEKENKKLKEEIAKLKPTN